MAPSSPTFTYEFEIMDWNKERNRKYEPNKFQGESLTTQDGYIREDSKYAWLQMTQNSTLRRTQNSTYVDVKVGIDPKLFGKQYEANQTRFTAYVELDLKTPDLPGAGEEGWIKRAMRQKSEVEYRCGRIDIKAFESNFQSFIRMEDLNDPSKGFSAAGKDAFKFGVTVFQFELRITLEEINDKIIRDVHQMVEDRVAILERELRVVNQKFGEHDQKFGQLEANSSELSDTLQQAIARISELDTKNNALEEKNNSSEETINSLREQINLLHAQINSSEAKINLLEAQFNLLTDQPHNPPGFFRSMFSNGMSRCMNYASQKTMVYACVLAIMIFYLRSLDYSDEWTGIKLASIILLSITAYNVYLTAKESHAAWLTQLNSLLAQLRDWWNSATTACHEYFRKTDDDFKKITASTIQILGSTQLILAKIPATQEKLYETITMVNNLILTLNGCAQKLSDKTVDCMDEFNRLLVELENTAAITGVTIERAEHDLNWQVGHFLNEICCSFRAVSNELAINVNTGREVALAIAENGCKTLSRQLGTLVNGVNRGIENGQFQPYVNAPVKASICTIL